MGKEERMKERIDLQRRVKEQIAKRPGYFPDALRELGCNLRMFDRNSNRVVIGTALKNNEPILLRNNPRNTDMYRETFAPNVLREKYGDLLVTVNTQSMYGHTMKKKVPLREYIDNLKQSRIDFKSNSTGNALPIVLAYGPTLKEIDEQFDSGLMSVYEVPVMEKNIPLGPADTFRLSIGNDLTGLPFHNHQGVANEVLVGKKSWFFYPATFEDESIGLIDRVNEIKQVVEMKQYGDTGGGDGGRKWNDPLPTTHWYENIGPAQWLTTVYPTLTPEQLPKWHCTTHPGDIIVMPKRTWHLTVNTGDEANGGLYTTILSLGIRLRLPKWLIGKTDLFQF
eukprot:g1707.t1